MTSDDPERLRRKAETCERLLQQVIDPPTLKILQALAREYRERAQRLQSVVPAER